MRIVKDKAQHAVILDKATSEKLYKDVQSYRLVTVATLVDRLKINGSLARQCLKDLEEKGQIKPIVTHSKMKIFSTSTLLRFHNEKHSMLTQYDSPRCWWWRLNDPFALPLDHIAIPESNPMAPGQVNADGDPTHHPQQNKAGRRCKHHGNHAKFSGWEFSGTVWCRSFGHGWERNTEMI